MKKVATKKGERYVQALAANERLWAVYKGPSRPDYLTARKDDRSGVWWFSVWGASEEEVKDHLGELASLEKAGAAATKKRGRGRLSDDDRCEICDKNKYTCGHCVGW